ncbi:hypothetical protein NQ318_007452 [Aromia moschata]|uniref:Uncharacterized protein n=1 Tax=Aromia moschata TaxID=1265417 RepID=A0AAV8YLZ9_9CUCU|nr:hypothetical protein NQ318_007452 [Aromia moschata]
MASFPRGGAIIFCLIGRPPNRPAVTAGSTRGFDVYNIETAMPKIDMEAIECHLRAAREEERREV